MAMPLPSPLVILQTACAGAAVALMALWPPQRGALLLVPLSGGSAALVDATVAARGTILGRGPFAGSLVVRGDRRRLDAALDRRDVLVVAARSMWCGAAAVGGASS